MNGKEREPASISHVFHEVSFLRNVRDWCDLEGSVHL